jgi:MFS superfamily sulfate permease-like transporter
VGLYTLPPALLAYALFGASRLLFVGPVSTVSVLTGSVVHTLSGGDVELAVQLTSVLAITAGLTLVAVGLLRLGWVAQFLSEPIVTGFVTGLVMLIVVGEVPALAGLPPPTGSIFEQAAHLLPELQEFDPLTLMVGLGALLVLFGGSWLAPRLPWSLIVLVGGIVLSARLDLAARGVRVVGDVPSGIPTPSIPVVSMSLWSGILTGGLAIAAVGIAEGLAAARTFAPRGAGGPETDDREFVAHGAADIASGVFGGMGVGGSLSKTAANARAGAYTQVSGVAAAVVVLGVLLFAANLLAPLPRAVLSAIVVHAVVGLVSVSAFRRYAALRRNDLVAAVVAVVGVLVLGPLGGLAVAVAQSLLGLVYRSMQVEVDEMGRVMGEKAAWGSVAHDPTRRTYPGVVVLRPDGPLFWANANTVVHRIEAMVDPRPGEGASVGGAPVDGAPVDGAPVDGAPVGGAPVGKRVTAVVLDLEATNQMDTTTGERLLDLLTGFRARGVDLYLVRVFGNVRDVLGRSGFLDELGPDHVWHSIAAGVKAARAAAPAPAGLGAADDPDGEAVVLDEPDDDHPHEHISSKRVAADSPALRPG